MTRARPKNFALVTRLAADGLTCGMTTIFSAAQVLLAVEAGASSVFPGVNRTTRLYGDGLGLVRAMRGVIDATGSPLNIVAASIKSADEAVASVLAGAHGQTLPLAILDSLGEHEGSTPVDRGVSGRGDQPALNPDTIRGHATAVVIPDMR